MSATERTMHDLLVSIAQLMEEQLAVSRHILARLGNGAQSSVELSENAKGAVQLTVKSYEESPLTDAGMNAIAEFVVLKGEIERQQMAGWRDTVTTLKDSAA